MARESATLVSRHFQTLYARGVVGSLVDSQLLHRFVDGGGLDREDAFAALVDRHGPMVLKVCRRMLPTPADAEDAFQAVFLVLARKAGSLREAETLSQAVDHFERILGEHAGQVVLVTTAREAREVGQHQAAGDTILAAAHKQHDVNKQTQQQFTEAQNILRKLPTKPTGSQDLVIAIGFLRLRLDSHSYQPELLTDVSTAQKNVERMCTAG